MVRFSLLAAVLASMLTLPCASLAQPRDEHAIDLTGGYGLSFPYDDSNVHGSGLIGGAEYGFVRSPWAGLRSYATLIWTWPRGEEAECKLVASHCEVTANALMLGAKGRFAIPIPYVAPFIELGLGATLGALRTQTEYRQKAIDGIALHIPLTLGLAIGPQHDLDIAMVFYFHPAPKQVNGGYALGVSIPLESGAR